MAGLHSHHALVSGLWPNRFPRCVASGRRGLSTVEPKWMLHIPQFHGVAGAYPGSVAASPLKLSRFGNSFLRALEVLAPDVTGGRH
jgi:hypothetical protein